MMSLILVSHELCPYVQRAAIVLREKGAAFEQRYVDLSNPPSWFQAVSPLGKTPVLLVDGQPIFESAVICEYLDDTLSPRLHPADPLQRAQQRGWMEYGSAMLNTIWAFYTAVDAGSLARQRDALQTQFARLEAELGTGPYFAGDAFSLVDAVFGPVFRYFDVFDDIADFGFLTGLPKVQAWRQALAARSTVQQAVKPDYPERLRAFLLEREGALAEMMVVA